MPRISVEDRSASAFRAGARRREPPARLSTPAKRLWREITGDRPVDFFRPGGYELLELFCEFTVQQRAVLKALSKLAAADEEYPRMLRSAAQLSSTLTALAGKLRISVQADVHRRSGKTGEKGDGEHDPLLGGAAVLRAVR
jgi:hypothetical protein